MATEALKKDQDKPRVDLVPGNSVIAAARAFTFGAKKYSPWNWMKGFEWLRLFGAVLRHLFAWAAGEKKDPESGLCHLDHALASLMMLQTHTELKLGVDDRAFNVVQLPDAASGFIPAAHVPKHKKIMYQWHAMYNSGPEPRGPMYGSRSTAEVAKEGLLQSKVLNATLNGTQGDNIRRGGVREPFYQIREVEVPE